MGRIVLSKDLKSVQLNMSLSAGPNTMNMMSLMILYLVQLSRMKSVNLKLLVILLSLSAQSGPEKSALLLRHLSQNILLTLDVTRYLERSVPLLAVDSQRDLRFVMTRPRPLSRMPPKKHVALS